MLTLVQDRLKTLGDLSWLTHYFFEEPVANESLMTNNKQLKRLSSEERVALLQKTSEKFEQIETWNPDSIQEALNELLEETGQKPGVLFSLIRIVTTWAPFSPALNETLALIGKTTTIQRIASACSAM